MHPHNPYAGRRPDFKELATKYPSLIPFLTVGLESSRASIDFSKQGALRHLTQALLKEDWNYDVELREDRLCPTLSNRVDYLAYVLDLEPYLAGKNRETADPRLPGNKWSAHASNSLRILDIGTGASVIYPLLLHRLRPNAVIVATEINDVSFQHAQSILSINNIPPSSISLFKAPSGPILFPLRDMDMTFDMMVCNPPFFASADEMQQGSEAKVAPAHAAPTGADNELITFGGEVTFVGRMIRESVQLGERCLWYTSLIGKYASLQPLVDLLRENRVENYFIRSIKPAKTVRWILAWSFSPARIPDSITRPDNLVPNTSYSRLFPPPNTLTHTPSHPAITVLDLHAKLFPVLQSIQLAPAPIGTVHPEPVHLMPAAQWVDEHTILLSPYRNTWSRAARRQAARGQGALPADAVASGAVEAALPNDLNNVNPSANAAEPLMRLLLRLVLPRPPPDDTQRMPTEDMLAGAAVELDFVWGKDRAAMDPLWKFLLTKAGLLGSQAAAEIQPRQSNTPHTLQTFAANDEDAGGESRVTSAHDDVIDGSGGRASASTKMEEAGDWVPSRGGRVLGRARTRGFRGRIGAPAGREGRGRGM